MYQTHFQLTRRPFGESAPAGGVVALPSRETARRRLRYGLEQSEGIALLYGPPGAGKTLLAAELAAELGGPSVQIAYPALPGDELLAAIADELKAPGVDGGAAINVRRIRLALANASARTLIVVDEAHLVERPETFESLRLLTNFASKGRSDAMLLLVGCAEVLPKLPPGVLDRVAARALVGALTEEECSAYLNGRARLAGAKFDLFDPSASQALYYASDGLPRRLNRLADFALLIAYAEGLDKPDARAIEAAVREAGVDPLGSAA